MSSWLIAALSAVGALPGLFALIKHQMNLKFYREMAERHGIEGLDAAARATRPGRLPQNSTGSTGRPKASV